MAEILRAAHTENVSKQSLEYRYRNDSEAGFSFDWENGKPVFKFPEAEADYKWCKEHPEEVEFLGITTIRWTYTVDAVAKCECGKEIKLSDDYYGCSQCLHCGRRHAMGGYEVNPPEEWIEDLEEELY